MEAGDKILINSEEWFDNNTTRIGICGDIRCFTKGMRKYCGKYATIESKFYKNGIDLYKIDIDGFEYDWERFMFTPLKDLDIPFKEKITIDYQDKLGNIFFMGLSFYKLMGIITYDLEDTYFIVYNFNENDFQLLTACAKLYLINEIRESSIYDEALFHINNVKDLVDKGYVEFKKNLEENHKKEGIGYKILISL